MSYMGSGVYGNAGQDDVSPAGCERHIFLDTIYPPRVNRDITATDSMAAIITATDTTAPDTTGTDITGTDAIRTDIAGMDDTGSAHCHSPPVHSGSSTVRHVSHQRMRDNESRCCKEFIMKLAEYQQVSHLSYREYCTYLQKKYGQVKAPWMSEDYILDPECSRKDEGLLVHHIFENRDDLIGDPKIARQFPYDWQEPQNLVYADILEHLLLHIMIAEFDPDNCMQIRWVVPNLNDFFSGWEPEEDKKAMYESIRNEKAVYFELLKRLAGTGDLLEKFLPALSFNVLAGRWSWKSNDPLLAEINRMLEDAGIHMSTDKKSVACGTDDREDADCESAARESARESADWDSDCESLDSDGLDLQD